MSREYCAACSQPLPDKRGYVLHLGFVRRGEIELALPHIQFKVFSLLYAQLGYTVTRDRLFSSCFTADTTERSLDSHIKRLRPAIVPLGLEIIPVYGFGYKLQVKKNA